MKKDIKKFLNKNYIYLLVAFALFSLFGIVLILLGVITKNSNLQFGGIFVLIISILIGLTYVVIGILGLIKIIKERKLKKVNNN
uniref:Hypothetical transmembrane protein n=1 Tax=Spiroplasma citri TaxID=2133 RepID=Q3ZVR0_SPICI|nr:hypothetical protein [Spiroplasma citri]CAI84909.1 hypothetical transmembrane protein [Spiroplasma citri]